MLVSDLPYPKHILNASIIVVLPELFSPIRMLIPLFRDKAISSKTLKFLILNPKP